ncbi:MAG: hypothetical protein ABIY48_09590, partial [Acidimicrobiales bacterium]
PARTRRWPWLLLGVAGIATFGIGIAGANAQGPGAVVNGLDAVAVSDGMEQTFGDPSTAPYPTATGDIAHTEATLSAGPTGYALASTAWPGPLAANAGSLAVLLGAPSQAGQANYSGRTEAFSPGGPHDAELPGMTAHADGGETEAVAGAQEVESSQGQTTGDVRSRSQSSFTDGVLRSVSSCTASDLGFAGGAVTIGSVRTEAEATTNGSSSESGGRTVVSGMKVAGQDAEVDEKGVRLTDPATAPIGEQVLSNFGISMYVVAPRHSEAPSAASHQAGSLVVIWDPPGTGYGYIYSICGSAATVALRTGLAFVSEGLTLPPTVDAPVVDGLGITPGFDAGAVPGPASTKPVVATPPVAAPVVDATPIDFVRNLSIWPYLVGALCVLASGIGLGRARDAALAPRSVAVACPLEGARR